MTGIFATSTRLGTTTWPLGYRPKALQTFHQEDQIRRVSTTSPPLKMSRSFYVDSLILNRPTPTTIDRNHTALVASRVASSLQSAKNGLSCFSHHHDALDSCSLCVRDHHTPTSCSTRLPPLPPTSIFNTTKVAIPIPHSTSSHHHPGAVTPPHRSILDHHIPAERTGCRDHHLRTSPVGLATTHVTRHGTPPSPPSHLQYRSSIDPRRLSPYLPVGK